MAGVSNAMTAPLLMRTPAAQWKNGAPPEPDWKLLKEVVGDESGKYNDDQKIEAYTQAERYYTTSTSFRPEMKAQFGTKEYRDKIAGYVDFMDAMKETSFGARVQKVQEKWDRHHAGLNSRTATLDADVKFYNTLSDFEKKALPHMRDLPTRAAIVSTIIGRLESAQEAGLLESRGTETTSKDPDTQRLLTMSQMLNRWVGDYDDPIWDEFKTGNGASVERAIKDSVTLSPRAQQIVAGKAGRNAKDMVAEGVVEMLKDMQASSIETPTKEDKAERREANRAKGRTFESIRDIVDVSERAKKHIPDEIQKRTAEQS